MNPAGVIITYMDWSDWKQWWFNIPLFLFQLTFMVVGTAIGKIELKIKKPMYVDYILAPVCLFGIVAYVVGITDGLLGGAIVLILLFFVSATLLAILTAILRGINWAVVWRAAQASHVRLVLERAPDEWAVVDVEWADGYAAAMKTTVKVWLAANFGHPKMEIQPWRLDQCKGQFEYREPTFETSSQFIEAMIEYANDQVGKRYDDLQLISSGLHLIAWIVYPPCWGKELKIIKAFNRPGGREFCSSGVTACLRWADEDKGIPAIMLTCISGINYGQSRIGSYDKKRNTFFPGVPFKCDPASDDLYQVNDVLGLDKEDVYNVKDTDIRQPEDFFSGYSTATTFPCMVPISKNWRKVK